MQRTIYYKDPETGEISAVLLFNVDATDAIRRFPDQYQETEEGFAPPAPAKGKAKDSAKSSDPASPTT